jgi:hypothetical protein
MLYKIVRVDPLADAVTSHTKPGKIKGVHMFRIQRRAPATEYRPSAELAEAFSAKSPELREAFADAVDDRD